MARRGAPNHFRARNKGGMHGGHRHSSNARPPRPVSKGRGR
jgi:hypothetical protein